MKNNRFNILKTTAMRNAWVVVFVVAGTTLTATSCADDDGAVASGSRQKVQLLVSVPTQTAAASQHRLADPGTAVPEGTDWDRLTVILAYADGSRVIKTTLTKTEFEALADYENHPGVKLLTIDAWLGEAYIYGVTYSSGVAGDPETAINACQSNTAVQGLTISNTYASGDVAKFVSVATGYYQTSESNNQPAPFTVTAEGVGLVSNLPTITLTRLATKIDVQWDVADAYENGYTDMALTKFSLTGTEKGYLFPAISHSSALASSTATFTNTTSISQRNGRQYHYTFTDGKTVPTTITFHLSGKQNGTTEVSKDYTLKFQSALQPATWYKVNATISGMEGATDYTLSNF